MWRPVDDEAALLDLIRGHSSHDARHHASALLLPVLWQLLAAGGRLLVRPGQVISEPLAAPATTELVLCQQVRLSLWNTAWGTAGERRQKMSTESLVQLVCVRLFSVP